MAIKKINREKIRKSIEERKQLEKLNEIKVESMIEESSIKSCETSNQSEEVSILDNSSKEDLKVKSEIKGYFHDEINLYLRSSNNLESVKIGNYIGMEAVKYDIDEDTYKALIEYRSIGGKSRVLMERSDYLNEKNLIKYQNQGLDVMKRNVRFITEYLRQLESEVPLNYVHSKLGFMEYKGKTIYKLHEAIGLDSTYVGECEIKPKGSYNEYINMIKNHVIGNVELEFAMVSGLSAILLGYIGEELGLDSTIIHLVGNSTTGKSTALKLAISSFGYPEVKHNGLYGTYNGTNNALIKKLGGLNGVPYALDEISMSESNDFTKFVYSLANGADKERLTKDSKLMGKESWLTTILSNGEKSITRSSNKNSGVQVRVIEAENFTWTKSSEHAEAINRVILNNHGHLAIKFANYLLVQNKKEIIKDYKQVKVYLYSELNNRGVCDDMSMRRCNKFAIIIQTAFILQELLEIELDVEGMIEMIVNIEKESIKCRNFQKVVIDFVKEYVDRYRNKFDGKSESKSQEVLGKITEKEDYTELQMEQLSFELMIKEGGYEDRKIVLKELKKAGFLDCEKDRLTRSRKNSVGVDTEYVVIKLPKDKEIK